MKRTLIALTVTGIVVTGLATSVLAQERYYRDSAPEAREDRRDRYGPEDVIRMLERRGYRVRDVNFERGRFFVKASRRGERVLVIVSRRGEILETRLQSRDRY